MADLARFSGALTGNTAVDVDLSNVNIEQTLILNVDGVSPALNQVPFLIEVGTGGNVQQEVLRTGAVAQIGSFSGTVVLHKGPSNSWIVSSDGTPVEFTLTGALDTVRFRFNSGDMDAGDYAGIAQ